MMKNFQPQSSRVDAKQLSQCLARVCDSGFVEAPSLGTPGIGSFLCVENGFWEIGEEEGGGKGYSAKTYDGQNCRNLAYFFWKT